MTVHLMLFGASRELSTTLMDVTLKAGGKCRTCLLVVAYLFSDFLANGQMPSILNQPQSQTVDYASDTSFSVTATGGEPLTYQWLKNGLPLADFNNIAGSQTSVLHLIGVAENDATSYAVVVANGGGSVTSAVVALTIPPSLKFSENFESGLSNWTLLLDSRAMGLNNGQNHTSGGGTSLLATNGAQAMYHNLEVKYACRVIFTFWMYDDGSSLTSCGQLRGYSGLGYGRYASPRSLWQEIAIGKYNSPFATNGASGALTGRVLDTNKYQGRILYGAYQGWFNLSAQGAPNRSIGWHKFQIDRSAAGSPGGAVDFYVDGVLSRTIKGVNGSAVSSILLGAMEPGNSNSIVGNVWFDDVTVEAYPALFDWPTLDSTGRDLFPDWMKLREVGTNAQVIDVSASTVSTVNGSATNGGMGNWAPEGASMCATGLRGYLEYTLDAPDSGAYRIEVEGGEKDHQMPMVDLPLIVSIGGETLGRFNLPYGTTTNGFIHCFTPFIQAGSHVIRLYWDNTSLYRKLYVQAIRLQSVSGRVIDHRKMKMWVANRLEAQCGVEFAPASSPVSPVCIEGRGQYLSMMSLSAGLDSGISPIEIHPGAGYRWYANVPLSSSHATVVEASFQNGGYKETNEIVWQVTNLLLATNNTTIRQGDSLLFAALPDGATEGEMSVTISGAGSVITNIDSPVAYQFDQSGIYTVTGTYLPTGATGSITVNVVNASFDSPAPARIFKNRYWSCTNLPPGVVLDADPRLRLVKVSDSERAKIIPTLPQKSSNELDFWVRITSGETQYVLARLGANGPVLAEAPVQGFRWNIAPDTYLRLIGTNNDGSQLVETAFVMSPLIPSLTVDTKIIVSGVTFEDGTVTKTLTANDFDSTGVCRLWFIRNAGVKTSVCHTTHLYDGTIMLSYQ